jgi:uncharacterized OB-fold protein
MENGKKQIPIQEGLFKQSSEGEPLLIGNRCKLCGLVVFPKTPVCPKCMTKDTMEQFFIKGKGKLYSYSIVNAALPGFRKPSIQAYIDLDDGPRIWSLVTDCKPSEDALKSGMDMEMLLAKVREDENGNELISYQFRPAKK